MDPAATTLSKRLNLGVLVAANVLPVLGVLFWGWSTGDIIFLYWAENVIVGVVNVLKILYAQGSDSAPQSHQQRSDSKGASQGKSNFAHVFGNGQSLSKEPGSGLKRSPITTFLKNIPVALFFTVHYGLFTFVHGIFVIALFLNGNQFEDGNHQTPNLLEAVNRGGFFGFTLLGLFGSHLFSFFYNYIGGRQFLVRSSSQQMFQPYGRIVVLHISLIAGGFLLAMLGGPMYALIVFVMLKILFEVGAMSLQTQTTLE